MRGFASLLARAVRVLEEPRSNYQEHQGQPVMLKIHGSKEQRRRSSAQI
jgi:hypothetical protein